jgi:lipopolysaccharide/colanic/teichoic acid biosynthesis glycosyltransferase/SAM-dependent methyltransferase
LLKRCFDIVLSAVGLLVFSPLILVCMLLIWMQDWHSPFYVAPRAARGGGTFRMIKFRSMVIRADASCVDSTAANDRRITVIGKFIRRTKLDELPQLWNVLLGQMSFVGPRPNVTRETDLYTAEERRLLTVRPGITDISSIVFSDEGDILQGSDDPDLKYNQVIRPWKSRLGLLYVDSHSIVMDLQLIFLTFVNAFSRRRVLASIQSIIERAGAPEQLRRVAARTGELPAAPPPGAQEVVKNREGDATLRSQGRFLVADNQHLRQHLLARQGFWDKPRIEALEARKREEIEFHNLDRAQSTAAEAQRAELQMHANRKWYSVTQPSRRYIDGWVAAHAKGRAFLDYACGSGEMTLRAARAGASIAVGLDISDESIRLARGNAEREGLAPVASFVQGDCEATEFPDATFDCIICSGMLHHLDLDRAYSELRRILRPGGRILCIEALAHNPLIQAYRNRTPEMRTEWESSHILGVPDAVRARRWFRLGEMRFWHLFDLASVLMRGSPAAAPVRALGRIADSVVLRMPGLRRMAWQFTFVLEHP